MGQVLLSPEFGTCGLFQSLYLLLNIVSYPLDEHIDVISPILNHSSMVSMGINEH